MKFRSNVIVFRSKPNLAQQELHMLPELPDNAVIADDHARFANAAAASVRTTQVSASASAKKSTAKPKRVRATPKCGHRQHPKRVQGEQGDVSK